MPTKHRTPTLPSQSRPGAHPAAKKPGRFATILVFASLAVVVVGILLLKERPPQAVALSAGQVSSPATMSGPTTASSLPAVNGPFKPSSPAEQLNEALEQGRPALVFMHSTTCQSCKDMMVVVAQVYPEFAGQVVLVDVDVNDNANGTLMQKLGLRYIPTVVVYDREGKASQNVGAMKADAFRTFLSERALGG